jgi:prepilin peptidase CpaA
MALIPYIFILLQLMAISYGDLKYKKIPNRWSLMNISIFVLGLFLFPHLYFFSWKTFVYPVAFLLVGFFLFYLKIMGGGDSKYLSSLYLIIPSSYHEMSFVYLLHSTLLIAPLIFCWMTLKKWKQFIQYFRLGLTGSFRQLYGSKFSYAPVILFSWIWMGWEKHGHKIFR